MAQIYHFSEFELDTAIRELRRNGDAVELPIKSLSCVIYLIEHRDRLVERDELMRAVWGHAHMTVSVLSQAIRHARQAFSDNGEDQRIIRTVRGFGYRWVAPVEVSQAMPADIPRRASPKPARPSASSHTHRLGLVWIGLALFAAIVAARLALHWPRTPAATSDVEALEPAPAAAAPIALLLPVEGADGPDDSWIRLGVMDFVSNRLRAAGQPMVPTDTIIMLLHGASMAGTSDLLALSDATHARLILEARAEALAHSWRVTLQSRGDAQPSITAAGEGADVLTAARNAADRLAIALGRIPAADPNEPFALSSLVQRIHAAILAQKPELAQQLIDQATPELRATPEIRYQVGRNAVYRRDFAAAQTLFARLLEDVPAERDPLLRARVLNGLGAASELGGDSEKAEHAYQQALGLLERHGGPETWDTLASIWLNLGNIAQARRDIELARERMAHARRLCESSGNVSLLAELELDLGVMDAREEDYANASHRFERAAALQAAIQNIGGELTSLSYAVEAKLELLDPGAAAVHEPRMRELLAMASQPWLVARAKLSLSDLLHATGRVHAAGALMSEVLMATDSVADLSALRREALVARAGRALDRDGSASERNEREVVKQLAGDSDGLEATVRAEAELYMFRANVARGNLDAAARDAELIAGSAHSDARPSPRIYAALAEAELAAARHQESACDAAYTRALALADESRIPQRMLAVVESDVGWLLGRENPRSCEDCVLRVVERIAEYADRDFGAALVRLRAYQTLGPRAAWAGALEHAKALAGDR